MRMLITGAGSGIGRAVAIGASQDAQDSPRLLLVDRDRTAVESVADEVTALGADCHVAIADLSDLGAPDELVEQARADLGGLDALISNAGMIAAAPLTELTLEAYDATMALNARVTWLMGKAAHPLLAQSRGSIVATASISGQNPTPPMGAYSTSKAALVMLIRQMAVEWGPDGIRCNCVSPGPTLTGLTQAAFGGDDPAQVEKRRQRESFIPLRRVGSAAEVANAILFLAGPAASQITGVDLLVDGGLSLTVMPNSGSGRGYGA